MAALGPRSVHVEITGEARSIDGGWSKVWAQEDAAAFVSTVSTEGGGT